MPQQQYDVIVVGAGCAGPAAARKAAQLGLKTLLLEKALVPGEKNVSGNLPERGGPDRPGPALPAVRAGGAGNPLHAHLPRHPRAHQRLPRNPRRRDPAAVHPARPFRLRGTPSRPARPAPRSAWAPRWWTSCRKAASCGGWSPTAASSFAAKVVIDAGGVNSLVGRRAGLIPGGAGTDMILYVTVAVHLGKKKIDQRFGDTIEYYLGPGLPAQDLAVDLPQARRGHPGHRRLHDPGAAERRLPLGERVHAELPGPARGCRQAGGRQDRGLGPAPASSTSPWRRRARDGLILTGEAGGFVAPFLGEGMPESFFTGIYAAEAPRPGHRGERRPARPWSRPTASGSTATSS